MKFQAEYSRKSDKVKVKYRQSTAYNQTRKIADFFPFLVQARALTSWGNASVAVTYCKVG